MDVNIPIVYASSYLESGPYSQASLSECTALAAALEQYGLVIISDHRMNHELNDEFIALMERYFRQPEITKSRDERASLGHQVGWTPSEAEIPIVHHDVIKRLEPHQRPRPIQGGDKKERFFVKTGPRPEKTDFPELNAAPVIPEGFPEWERVMGRWSEQMLRAVFTTCEMAAIGFGAELDLFTRHMKVAPHLLAPTGSDLGRHRETGTVLAGFHNDLNFITGHSQSNYPGLYAWTRNGRRFRVKVPNGCVLMQAGQEMEMMTGGKVLAGFHEVIVDPEARSKVTHALKRGERPWRISSTLFAHADSDAVLEPLGPFRTDETCQAYPPVKAGTHVARVLQDLNLAHTDLSQ